MANHKKYESDIVIIISVQRQKNSQFVGKIGPIFENALMLTLN